MSTTDPLEPWERALMEPISPPPPLPRPLRLYPSQVRPGMRLHNGHAPYMAVRATEDVSRDGETLTRITYSVGDRTFHGVWMDRESPDMAVATPSIHHYPYS